MNTLTLNGGLLDGAATVPGVLVALPADLVTAAWVALSGDLGLVVAFGRLGGGVGGWLWYEEDDPPLFDVPLPYAVLALDTVGTADPPTFDGDTVQPVWLRCDVYAGSRATATALGRQIVAAFDADPDTRLEWENGAELFRRIDRPDPEPLPGGFGPSGEPIAGVRVRIEFMIQFNIYAS